MQERKRTAEAALQNGQVSHAQAHAELQESERKQAALQHNLHSLKGALEQAQHQVGSTF